MISPSTFRDLVSGRRRGLGATVLRSLLRLGELPYTWAMRIRNRRYDRGTAQTHLVDVPVVCVGNLTMGGTGKTPMVEWVARHYRERGIRVSIVSRGYRAGEDGRNDESLELELALPDVRHLQNVDRVAAAEAAIDELETELILLDDGFQHRRLERDLDIVLLDATEPFGYQHVFPRGTLREPLCGLSRADVVVLSRADMLAREARDAVKRQAEQLAPQALWCEVEHAPRALISSEGDCQPCDTLAGKRVAAFCGIGNPAGFRHTLESLGAKLVAWREFADHHCTTRDDVASLVAWAADAELAICTRKDLVKLQIESIGKVPLRALSVELQFSAGEQALREKLDSVTISL